MSTPAVPRTAALRLSHAVVGMAAIHQLIGSEFMEPPWEFDEASALQKFLFETHEWVGLAATAAVLLMIWGLWRRYGTGLVQHFLPWLGAGSRSTLTEQLRLALAGLKRLNPPRSTEVATLAAAWEGLGMLTMLFLALSGSTMVLLEDVPQLMESIAEVHELGALPLKVYLAGHAGMAVLHELRGEGLLRRMWGGRQA